MMQKLIEGFNQQLTKAIEIGKNINVHKPEKAIQNIVVAGLGGSGIGANLVESWIGKELKVPFIINKTYDAPQFINENTLFIACSFSGGTEETLDVFEQVLQKGAKIFCISSGGKLIEEAQKLGLDYVQIPNEAPCPRAFLGYSFVQQLYALYKYNLISNHFEADLEEAIKLIEVEKTGIHTIANEIAQAFLGKLPFIYADSKLLPAITRLQQQVNENAKQLCHINILPEMNHNELVGWGLEKENYADDAVLFIQTSEDHPRVKIRAGICKSIISEKASSLMEVSSKGNSFIAQNIYLIHLFDWASFYLAALNQVDPFPVSVITHLKDELAKI